MKKVEKSIRLLHEGQVEWAQLISLVVPMEEAENGFKSLDENPALIKILIHMGEEK